MIRSCVFLVGCFVLLLAEYSFAQDSIVNLAVQLEYDYPDSAISLVNQRINSGELSDEELSNAYEVMGIAQWINRDYGSAINSHSEALRIRNTIDYRSGILHSHNNLGLNLNALGNTKMAMESYLNALKVAEEIPDSFMIAKVLGNIGSQYEEQNANDEALRFYKRSLDVLELGEKNVVLANTLYNIGLVYHKMKEFDEAKSFVHRSLTVRKAVNDRNGIAQSLNLLGVIYAKLSQFAEADNLFRAALEDYTAVDNQWGLSMVHTNLGENAIDQKAFSRAIDHCSTGLKIAKAKRYEWEESACKCLALAYTELKQADKASEYWVRVIAIKDSLKDQNKLSEILLLEKRFEFEKEQQKIQAEYDRQQLVAEGEIERQKLLRQASIGLGMMGVVLFFVAFRSYRSKQRDNELLETKNAEISAQNAVIEEKNLHITDSIRYAQNLQAAILPKKEMFSQYFADHSILYRPKDIVSGDFYWMEEANGLVFLAAADCTGHGVPGAMVSMVGYQGLNKAVLEEKLTSPAAILQRLSDYVEEAFEKSGGSVKDGMDICLCAIDTKKRTVTYAGAHNALWVLTSKEDLPNANLREEENGMRMFELKADRRSIGGFMDAGSFTETTVSLNQGDRLFLFSDGFADQFGGPQGKKMGSKRMRETLREMALFGNLLALGAIFEDWKGKEGQIDDVTVITVTV
ncbi:MAG: hypothetical protein RL266_361 [Bacteroidota bacterium]